MRSCARMYARAGDYIIIKMFKKKRKNISLFKLKKMVNFFHLSFVERLSATSQAFSSGKKLNRCSHVCACMHSRGHGLLYTRPYILPTKKRVGHSGAICDQTSLISECISMSGTRRDEFIFWEKLLGEIWAFRTFCYLSRYTLRFFIYHHLLFTEYGYV